MKTKTILFVVALFIVNSMVLLQAQPLPSCQAYFESEITATGVVAVWDSSYAGEGDYVSQQTWTVEGDMVFEGPQITYTPAFADSSEICLTIQTDFGCTDTYCGFLNSNPSGGGGGTDTLECSISTFFTSVEDSSYYGFTATAFSGTSPYSYVWTITNAANVEYYQDETFYDFLNAGDNEVCLTAYDAEGCSATYCELISVSGSGTGGVDTLACDFLTSFTYESLISPITGIEELVLTPFISGEGTSPFIYEWTVSQDSISWETYVSNFELTLNPTPGAYDICLTATDSEGCSSSACDFIFISGGPSCDIVVQYGYEVDYNLDGSALVSLDGYPEGSAGPFTFEWSIWTPIGTEEILNGQNIELDLPEGIYQFCLTATDSNGCTATDCGSITISAPGPEGFNLCGAIGASGTTESLYGWVLLIAETASGSLEVVDETYFSGTSSASDSIVYCFSDVPAGHYTVQAVVSPDVADYPYFIPTYLGDVIFWNDAEFVTLTEDYYTATIDIFYVAPPGLAAPQLTELQKAAGGTVSGTITDPSGTPLSGVQVMLLNPDGSPIMWTSTDESGHYEFPTDPPSGDLLVYVEALGIITYPATIEVTSANPNVEGINFEIDEVQASVVGIFNLTNNSRGLSINAYPNPSTNNVQIELLSDSNTAASIKLYSIDGRQVIQEGIQLTQGFNSTVLNISELSLGFYTLQITTETGQTISQKLIKN